MINEARYNKTIEILVQAYFNDTLQHQLCQACAVGNLVAYYTNQTKNGKYFCSDYNWSGPVRGGASYSINDPEGLRQVELTGYTAKELQQIEYAFEFCARGITADEHMFNGLMAVIETLDQIHCNTDQTVTTRSKSLFVKQPA